MHFMHLGEVVVAGKTKSAACLTGDSNSEKIASQSRYSGVRVLYTQQ